jgi:hypothetical protein
MSVGEKTDVRWVGFHPLEGQLVRVHFMYNRIKMNSTKSKVHTHQQWDINIEKYKFYIYNKIESTFCIQVQTEHYRECNYI